VLCRKTKQRHCWPAAAADGSIYIVGGSSGIAGLLQPLWKSLVGGSSEIAGLLQPLFEGSSWW